DLREHDEIESVRRVEERGGRYDERLDADASGRVGELATPGGFQDPARVGRHAQCGGRVRVSDVDGALDHDANPPYRRAADRFAWVEVPRRLGQRHARVAREVHGRDAIGAPAVGVAADRL